MLIGHKKQWEFLRRKFELGQLAHAYLLSGEQGIGKKTFSEEFVKFANCLGGKQESPCQKCSNCIMIEKGSFPDFKIIRKKQGKSEIEILQARDAQKFLSYKPYYGRYKMLAVYEAEKMSQEAQNCLLKTLEEPKGNAVVFLVASKPDMLLPTIISRCQIIKFFKPADFPQDNEKIKKEQKILSGLLSVVDSDLSDKFKYIKSLNFEEQDPMQILEVMQKYFRNQLLNNFSNKKALEILELSEEISQKLLFTNANPKLALEVLLMEL